VAAGGSGHDEQVLDAHAAETLTIEPGLNGDHHALLQNVR
jgi:hypothetical protein